MFEESVMDLVLLVAAHADERAFRPDAPLLLDLLSEVYEVRLGLEGRVWAFRVWASRV